MITGLCGELKIQIQRSTLTIVRESETPKYCVGLSNFTDFSCLTSFKYILKLIKRIKMQT